MWAALGNIQFETKEGPSSFDKEASTEYAQHNYIQGKPLAEMTSLNLDVISLTIVMHFQASAQTPEQRIAALETARINGDVMTFVFENGVVYGDFVIQSFKQGVNATDPKGYLVAVEIQIELLEYVEPDYQDAKARAAQKYAYANKGVAGLPIQAAPVIPNAAQDASLQTLAASGETYYAGETAKKLTPGNLMSYVRKITAIINQVSLAARRAQTIVTAAQNLPNSGNLATALQNVWQGADAFNQQVPTNTVTQMMTGINGLSNLTGSSQAALADIAGLVSTRKPF